MQSTKRILSIEVKHIDDNDCDTSYLGKYSNEKAGDFSIVRAHKPDCASVSKAAKKVSDQLERVSDYLAARCREIGNDSDNPYYWGIDEARDIVGDASETVTECDCGKYLAPGEYRYFNPASVEAFDPNASWLPAHSRDCDVTKGSKEGKLTSCLCNCNGMPEAEKRAYWEKTMRQNAWNDYERMESLQNGEWSFIGIRAQADIVIGNVCQSIHSGGLWGIESDSEKGYFGEVEREELAELRGILNELGFSKRAIAAAIKESK